jgi:membrane-bound lytic murein transglycosylase D
MVNLNTTILFIICLLSNTIYTYAQFETNESNYNIYAVNTPVNLSFANEKTPIYQLDIKERFDKEILINTYWQSKTILLIKRSKKYFSIIEPILKQHNIPDDFKYLAVAESGLENVTSPSGAKGFWQILEKTGIELGLEINNEIDERYHIEKSTKAACQYLQKAYNTFGNWTLAAAAYNMGIYGLQESINTQKVNSYYDLMLNNETYRYVFRILALKEIIENHENYGFVINRNDYYESLQTYSLEINTSIESVADFALAKNVNYKILKQFNPWIRKNTISNAKHKQYILKLPVEKHVFLNDLDTIQHICKSRENIFEIARKYDVAVEKILLWNDLLPSEKLKKNRKIIILK